VSQPLIEQLLGIQIITNYHLENFVNWVVKLGKAFHPAQSGKHIKLFLAKVVQPTKLRKRKSVRFSDKLVNGPGGCSEEEEELSLEDGEIQDANNFKKHSPEDCSQIFRVSST
jgi:hypothetical protein